MATDVLTELLQYRAELFGFIRAIVHSTHDAEDLFQEVARVIVRKAETGIDVRDFRAWSKEIARRLVKAHFRTRQAHANVYLPSEEMVDLLGAVYTRFSPGTDRLSAEHDALHACLSELSRENRVLLHLRFFADQAYDAMARRLRRTEAAIRRATSRARLALVQCVRRRLQAAEQPG
ncbi:MAG: sigma-70 family RNA polymerase sigma factor [Kiritimatiellae bacterium]|nr:sigma-70 family RNA polymerase sigma factor [Kiritimatiellia bacterium]